MLLIALFFTLLIYLMFCKRTREGFLFIGDKWNNYEFGNIFFYNKDKKEPSWSKGMEKRILDGKFKNSIAEEYYFNQNKHKDYDTLNKIINKRKLDKYPSKI